MSSLILRRSACAVAVFSALVAGCQGPSADPATLVQSGRAYVEKGDYPAAVIQFKNALQKTPDSAEIRFLLASTLSAAENPAAAIVEFRKARDLGYAREAVDRRIATTLLELGDTKAILREDLRAESAEGRAEIQSVLGEALLGSGDEKKAAAAFAEAARLDPASARARVGQARIAASRGDLQGARALLDALLQSAPTDLPALLLRADVLKATGQGKAAVADLEKAVAAKPKHLGARFNLALTEHDLGMRDRLDAHIAEMKKYGPADPRTAFVEGLALSGKGQARAASDAMQRVQKDMPDYVPALVLGGMLSAQLDRMVQAEAQLSRALERQPGNVTARRVLAGVHLRNGDVRRAQDVLAPALKAAPENDDVVATAAEVALAQGDTTRAAQLLQQIVARSPSNTTALIRLGEVRLREGNVDAALKQFELAGKAGPDDHRPDIAMIGAYMSRRAYEPALKAWSRLEAKQPKNPLTHDLEGQIHLAMGDRDKARASFERAVALQASYFPAQNRIAALDIAAGRPEAARKRFEELAKAEPGNATPLLALAQVMTSTAAPPGEITETLQRAVKADATSPEPRLTLANWLMRINETRAARSVAQEGVAAFPDNRALMQALATAQLASGETEQAITLLGKIAANPATASPEAMLLLARAHAQSKDLTGAVTTLRRAVEARPDAVNLRRELALTLVAAKEPQRALDEARRIKALKDGAAAGALVEGDIHAAQQRWPEAAAAYRQAVAAGRSGLAVARLHTALTSAGKRDEANAVIDAWRRDVPRDEVVPAYLSERAMAAKDFALAVKLLTPLVAQSPSNAVYLNNLAWSAAQLGDDKAEEYAERAWKLQPYSPAVADTYGWILSRRGELKRAVPLLEQAARQSPGSAEIRLHLAEALQKANRKDDAKRELEAILKLPDSAGRQAAEALLKSL